MYQIMNKELTAFSMRGFHCLEHYEKTKSAHIDINDSRYGEKLVKMKTVKSGVEIKLKLKWTDFYWKPHFSFKYNNYFHWLFIMIWFDFTYSEVIDHVVCDHLSHLKKE